VKPWIHYSLILSTVAYLCLGNHASAKEWPDDLTGQPIPVGRGIWKHNDSAVYLIADGARRQFFYQMPSSAMRERGPKSGTLLFDGRRDGDTYSGTAYAFSKQCGPIGYSVVGTTSADQRRVTLRGRVPVRNSACQPNSYRDDVLDFDFVFRKEADKPQSVPPPMAGSIKASILANPHQSFANDIQFFRPSEDEIAKSLVMSIIIDGNTISTCFYTQVLTSNKEDDFIGQYFNIVGFHAATAAELTKLGYPEAVWGSALNDLSQGFLNEIIKRRNLNQRFPDYQALKTPVNNLEAKLVSALEQYRVAYRPNLLKNNSQPSCGGGTLLASFN
jgi:hypothetical protein